MLSGTEHLFNYFDDNGFLYDKERFTTKASDIAKYFIIWAENYSIHKWSIVNDNISPKELVAKINGMSVFDDLSIFDGEKEEDTVSQRLLLLEKRMVTVENGVSLLKKLLEKRFNDFLDMVAWLIPFKSLRDKFRNKFK